MATTVVEIYLQEVDGAVVKHWVILLAFFSADFVTLIEYWAVFADAMENKSWERIDKVAHNAFKTNFCIEKK